MSADDVLNDTASATLRPIEVFVSYAREDETARRELAHALAAREITARGDWQLVPGIEYRQQLGDLITTSHAVLILLSPHWTASADCAWEAGVALDQKKRVVPILISAEVDAERVEKRVRELQWLVCTQSDPTGTTVDALQTALRTNSHLVEEHSRLTRRAREWQSGAAALLNAKELESADAWRIALSASPESLPQVSAVLARFLTESETAQRARLRTTTVVSATVAIVVIALSGAALLQRNAAITARDASISRQLAMRARQESTADPSLGILLALSAERAATTAESRKTLMELNERTPRLVAIFDPDSPDHGTVDISSDNKLVLASHSYGTSITVWDLESGARRDVDVALAESRVPVNAVAFRPFRHEFALRTLWPAGHLPSGTTEFGTLWNADSGRQVDVEELPSGYAAAFSDDGATIAFAVHEVDVAVWRPGSGLCPDVIVTGFDERVGLLRWGADGTVVAVSEHGMLAAWDPVRKIELLRRKDWLPLYGWKTADLSWDGDVAVCVRDQSTYSYRISDGVLLGSRHAEAAPIESVALNHDGNLVALGHQDGSIEVSGVLLSRADEMTVLRDARERERDGRPITLGASVEALAFSRDGTRLVSGAYDGTVLVWDVDDLDRGRQSRASERISGGAFVPNSGEMVRIHVRARPLAIGGDDVRVVRSAPMVSRDDGVRLDESTLRRAMPEPDGRISRRVWTRFCSETSPDTELLAEGGCGALGGLACARGEIRVWRTRDGSAALPVLEFNGGQVFALAFRRDSRVLAAGSYDGSVSLWDVGTGQLLRTAPNPLVNSVPAGQSVGSLSALVWSVTDLAFTHDGRQLAVLVEGGKFCLLDASSLAPIGEPLKLPGGYGPGPVRALGDSGLLAIGAASRIVLYDLATRSTVGELTGHEHDLRSMIASPKGDLIASVDGDDAIRLWDVRRRELITSRRLDDDAGVRLLSWSGDGSHIAYACDGDLLPRLWDVTARANEQRSLQLVKRRLSRREFETHLAELPYPADRWSGLVETDTGDARSRPRGP